MNAGCYGAYVADLFRGATAVDRRGRVHRLTPADMGFGYRCSALPPDMIVTDAEFEGTPGEPDAILARMEALLEKRALTQPVRERSAGSTFRNPSGFSSTGVGESVPLTAWRLIDAAGCRGLSLGGAQMSPMHPNFLVNTGGATAANLENLGEEVRSKVFLSTGIQLEWEVMRIGVNPAAARDRRAP
jgi:UDP-N-acetylmuramate dehydrogenase